MGWVGWQFFCLVNQGTKWDPFFVGIKDQETTAILSKIHDFKFQVYASLPFLKKYTFQETLREKLYIYTHCLYFSPIPTLKANLLTNDQRSLSDKEKSPNWWQLIALKDYVQTYQALFQ